MPIQKKFAKWVFSGQTWENENFLCSFIPLVMQYHGTDDMQIKQSKIGRVVLAAGVTKSSGHNKRKLKTTPE